MLLATAYSTVSDIEVVWMVVALAGLLVTVFNLREAIGDRNFLIEQGIGNGRKLVSNVTIYTESTRIFVHAVFLLIGVIAAFLPETPQNANLSVWQVAAGVTIRWGLIFSSLILMSQSVALRWMRKQLRKDD